jgi:hypothetical protein
MDNAELKNARIKGVKILFLQESIANTVSKSEKKKERIL